VTIQNYLLSVIEIEWEQKQALFFQHFIDINVIINIPIVIRRIPQLIKIYLNII